MGKPKIFSGSRQVPLQRSAGDRAGCPTPLEIEASKMASHIDDLADEVKARDFAGLHRFGQEFVGVNAAGCDFGFFIAFGACGMDGPGVELGLQIREGLIRE
jgi:hypothetical protein